MTVSKKLSQHRSKIFLALLAALSILIYLFLSNRYAGPGFPLDDAWIHQTYARNLAHNGEWSFIPNQPSAGSTSPLWSAILAIGYWLHFGATSWVYLLGWLQLWSLGLLSIYGLQLYVPHRHPMAVLGGILMVLEFHLVWAAASGMETLLYSILVVSFLIWLARPNVDWFRLGLWAGLSVWVRPDGITLIGPAIMVLALTAKVWKDRITNGLLFLGGFFLFFGPYLWFNRSLAGAWWPNTFFAKQAEYAILLDQSILVRLTSQLVLPLVGVGVILLPGFVWFVIRSFRQRKWAFLSAAIWFVGYLFMYAWRLPVTYQHGRYVIPAMAVYFLCGTAGMIDMVDFGAKQMVKRVLYRAWLLSGGLILISFWLRGAFAYAQDVAVIQTEMVATAHWVAENTPAEALIAAHDIGALGYFGNRQLLDLAGLISPEVIPFIRDEQRLAQYLDQKDVDYLVTFPGWYPELVQHAELIHSTKSQISPSLGGENMNVYRWHRQ